MNRVVPEALLYFFSKEISQYLGIYWVLIIGHTAGVLRMFWLHHGPCWSLLGFHSRNLGLYSIYALEWLKGVNSSLVISSAARIASDMAPKGLASTAQGLVAGTLARSFHDHRFPPVLLVGPWKSRVLSLTVLLPVYLYRPSFSSPSLPWSIVSSSPLPANLLLKSFRISSAFCTRFWYFVFLWSIYNDIS